MSSTEHEKVEPARPRGGRRRTDDARLPNPGRWLLLGVSIALVVGFTGIFSFTQTQWGRAQVLAYTVETLGGRLDGVLTIGRLEGNLITGARLYELDLRSREGEPLAVIDSAYIRYRVGTLVGGDVVITRLVAWDAQISLLRMPGDTAWNYQEILRDPDPDPTARPGATLIESLSLHDSRITIRGPIEPDPRLPEPQRSVAFDEILADTARWMVEPVPGGYLRTMLIDVDESALSEVYIGPDERGGIYLEADTASADIRLWRDPPLQVRDLVAQLHLREGIVNLRAPRLTLPNTRGEMVGRIDLREERPMYDVVLTTPAFALADLRWLYPWLPEDPAAGQGAARVWIEDRPEELLVFTRDFVLDMPGTRLTGDFGVLTGQRLRFVDVELEADPLDLESIERLFPEDLPIDGLEIGGAAIRGVR